MRIKPQRSKEKLTNRPAAAGVRGTCEIHKPEAERHTGGGQPSASVKISAGMLLRNVFRARAVECTFCGRAFVPGKDRDADYCSPRCSNLAGAGYDPRAAECLLCGAPLSQKRIKQGIELCPPCQAGEGGIAGNFSGSLVSVLV